VDPQGLSGSEDFLSTLITKEITTLGRIKLAKYSREGTRGFAEIASASTPEFCTSQHPRSPTEGETGQFAPQQGPLIAACASALSQPKPACSASTNASKAMTHLRTA
jgi:hypothetical protein